ncbi:MAG TPA: hypothetical protein VGI54_02010, partial [Solirubrobacteraceae bacterium]
MTTETPPEAPQTETPETPEPAPKTCPNCGAPIRPDQEWCLECGGPVGVNMVGPPSWRVPVIVISALVLLAGIAVAIAFAQLSDDSKTVASLNKGNAPATAPAPTASTPKTSTG